MQNEVTSSNGILDIIVPIIPESDMLFSIFIVVTLVITSFVSVILWRMFMTSKGKARRRLASLQQQYKNSSGTVKVTAFHIADIVKEGLELTCLSFYRIIPHCHQPQGQDWELFVKELDTARYSSVPFSRDKVRQLMHEAMRWIK